VRSTLPLLHIALVSSLGMACSGLGPSDTDIDATAEFADTLAITTSTRLVLRGINGTVAVTGNMPAGTVIVEGMRRVRSDRIDDARDRLNDISVRITELGNAINVTTEHLEDPDGRSYEVDYRVFVPPTFQVDVEQVNGEIRVLELRDGIVINSVNGSVDATQVSGNLQVNVTNGAIEADVTLRAGGVVDLSTVNGDLSLTIPASTSSTLEATIVNGSIEITNLLLDGQTITSSRVTGTLGGGNGTITLTVTNGGISAIGR
jgi:Toastrack DUF4097